MWNALTEGGLQTQGEWPERISWLSYNVCNGWWIYRLIPSGSRLSICFKKIPEQISLNTTVPIFSSTRKRVTELGISWALLALSQFCLFFSQQPTYRTNYSSQPDKIFVYLSTCETVCRKKNVGIWQMEFASCKVVHQLGWYLYERSITPTSSEHGESPNSLTSWKSTQFEIGRDCQIDEMIPRLVVHTSLVTTC